jgi:hypothetical protein
LEGLALKRARIYFLLLSVFLLLLTACGNAEGETDQEKNTETDTEVHTKDREINQKENISNKMEETTPESAAGSEQESSDAVTSSNKNDDNTSAEVEAETEQSNTDQQPKTVNSADEAIALLKERLAITEEGGLIIDPMGGTLEADDAGAYYTLVLKVKAWVENGGSGTAGIYRVYEDGTIIDQYTEEPTEQAETTDTKVVTSPDDAAALLKERLNIQDNKDLIVGTAEDSETDKNGTYYHVSLKSESAIAKGGTGTAGIYRVYDDGTIIDAYTDNAIEN